MKRKKIKWLSLLLALVMVLGVMTVGAAAEEEPEPEPEENDARLLVRWLDWDDEQEAWYEPADGDRYEGFGITPLEEFYMIFYACTWDSEREDWDYTPVQPEVTEGTGLELSYDVDACDGETNASYFVHVTCSQWNQSYRLTAGSLELWGSSYLPDVGFYSSSTIDTDNFIIEFRYTDEADGNVFYLGVCIPEDADYHMTELSLTDEDVTDRVTVEPVEEGKLYKITIDDDTVAARESFWLGLHCVMENEDGDTWISGTGIQAEPDEQLPRLMNRWLEWDDEAQAWYEVIDEDHGLGETFNITPLDEFYLIFYSHVWDSESGEWVDTPVKPQVAEGEGLILDYDWPVACEDETNGDYFVRITCTEWNQDYALTYTVDNKPLTTVSNYVTTSLYEAGYYLTPEISEENFINSYDAWQGGGFSPFGENTFYFGINLPEDADYGVEEVWTVEGAENITLTKISNTVYQITVTDEAAWNGWGFYLELGVRLRNIDGDSWEYTCGIGVQNQNGVVWLDELPEGAEEEEGFYFYVGDEGAPNIITAIDMTEGDVKTGVLAYICFDEYAGKWLCYSRDLDTYLVTKDGVKADGLILDGTALEAVLTANRAGTYRIYPVFWTAVTDENGEFETDENGDYIWEPSEWTYGSCVTVTVARKSTPVTPGKPSTGSGSSTSKTEEPALPFTDVSENASYYDAVKYVYEQDLMNGTSDTKFSPSGPLNRAMVVTILHRLEGEPAVSYTGKFPDVAAGTWYTEGVEWAATNNIVTGYTSGSYGPTDPVTREQLAAILYRYAVYKGYDVTKTVDLAAYTDGANVSEYAETAVAWAVANGILESANSAIRPRADATRAEVAVAVAAFHETFVK